MSVKAPFFLRAMAIGFIPFSIMQVSAQGVANPTSRDPTKSPAVFSISTGERAAPKSILKPRNIVIVGGTRYLVWNSRRYAVGESIDGARIEKISETEVWLRGAEGLQKFGLYTGIDKRPTSTTASATTTKTSGQPAVKKGPIK